MQFSTRLIALPLPALVYLVLIAIGYGAIGWLLAAFQASLLLVFGTIGIAFHLTCVGRDGIVLANGWTAGIFAIAAVFKAWAPSWGENVPYTNAQYWAWTLILLWAGSVLLLLSSTGAKFALKTLGVASRRVPLLLFLLVVLAIGGGDLTYRLF